MTQEGRASLKRPRRRTGSGSGVDAAERSPELLLHSVRIDPAYAGERLARLPFLAGGPVAIEFGSPLTLLVGENGSGKTTLLEAIAARCGIQPGGGDSYAETEDERDTTPLSDAVDVTIADGWRPRGLFLRADRFAEIMAHAGRLPMPLTGEWRLANEQSRGEGVLSLLSARVDASERMLFLLDEPETGLSPQRQLILLALLDELHRDGRSQAIVATHSPILLSHPGCDRLWIDGDGIARRDRDDIPHWREMHRFMRDPAAALRRLLPEPPALAKPTAKTTPARRALNRPVRLWVLSDLHLEAVPHPEAYRPKPPTFDVLVVAGDVWEGECRRALEIVARLADGKPAVFVIGNHEVWGAELQAARANAYRAAAELGVTLLDDSEAELAGLRFVGGTLWREVGRDGGALDHALGEPIDVEAADGRRAMTLGDAAAHHARARGLIKAAIARPGDGRLVVVTHDPPPSAAASAGASSGRVAVWIHGHVHGTSDAVRSDGLRVVCNAAGPGFGNLGFLDDMVIEV